MLQKVPSIDGDLNQYNLSGSSVTTPVLYFVNGINTSGLSHSRTAGYLSALIERPVWGVYNKTDGMVMDLAQCLADYTQNATARLGSSSNKPAKVPDSKIPQFLRDIEKNYTVWNKATVALFRQLALNKGRRQLIVAHSQGNLVTSNALFVMEDVFGSASLQNVRVYSLASPSPAWPVSLRYTNGGGGRQDNAFMNDMVALLRPHNLAAKLGAGQFRNAGDFRTLGGAGAVSLAPHDATTIINTLNFLKSVRGDLGLPKDFTNEFLARSAAIVDRSFPEPK